MTEVLFVDPDAAVYNRAARIFGRCRSVALNHAGSAEDAVRYLSANCADVIVSAYELPGMTALDLLCALRTIGLPVPFIIFTERASEKMRQEAYRGDVFGFIARKDAGENAYSGLLRLVLWASEREDADIPVNRRVIAH